MAWAVMVIFQDLAKLAKSWKITIAAFKGDTSALRLCFAWLPPVYLSGLAGLVRFLCGDGSPVGRRFSELE